MRCCVTNCEANSKFLHRFPRNVQRAREWLQAIGRQDLFEQKLESLRVCDIHFAQESRVPVFNKNRTNLKANAIPSLNLGMAQEWLNVDDELMISEDVVTQEKMVVAHEEVVVADKEDVVSSVMTQMEVVDMVQECEDIFINPSFNQTEGRSNMSERFKRRVNAKIKRIETLKKLRVASSNMCQFAKDLDNKKYSNEKHIRYIVEFVESDEFLKGRINNTSYKFLLSQINEQRKKPRGRRYSLEDKIFALSLLKQGPKLYRLLQKVFALPSRKTLRELLKKSSFAPGINRQIINKLKEEVLKMKKIDKYCMLVFDETYLSPALTYNKVEDLIEGIEDVGERKPQFADHAMVFMLRGIASKWKQPVAYYFVKSGMSNETIAIIIRDIIKLVHEIDLRVVGTVCDQYNARAINLLKDWSKNDFLSKNEGAEYKSEGFLVDDKEVIPIYDVPHLLKGIRNQLLKYDCQFKWKKNNVQIASWRDVVKFYELDIGDYDTKMCNRLTDAHIYEEKMKKMNVRCAAQVFSQRVSASMRAIVKYGEKNYLSEQAVDTADFLLFIDKVFDSLNGSSAKTDYAKPLRSAIHENSNHLKFYDEAIKVFSNIKFKKNSEGTRPPSVKNFIVTLRGVKEIWKICQKEGEFKFLCPRNLNQDPLENFFGMIKSHGYRNVSPNCSSFHNSYKALLINNFFSFHSPGANCEEDFCESAITSFHSFLKNPENVLQIRTLLESSSSNIENLKRAYKSNVRKDIIIEKQNAYIAGYIGKKIIKTTKGCTTCREQLHAKSNESFHQYINYRNFTSHYSKALFKPNSYSLYLFNLCSDIMHLFLPNIFHQTSLREELISVCRQYIIPIFSCKKHDLLTIFLDTFVTFYIFAWVKNVNQILNGFSSNKINDNVKVRALEYYKKHKGQKMTISKAKRTI